MNNTVKQILNQDIKDNAFLEIQTLRALKMPANELAAEIVNFLANGNKKMSEMDMEYRNFVLSRMEKQIKSVMKENWYCPECTKDCKSVDNTEYDEEKGCHICECGYEW